MNLHILFYVFVFLISACGGGTTQVNSVNRAELTVDFVDQNAFQLGWEDVANATYYQIFKRDSDHTSFQQVGSDIAAGKKSDGETYYFADEQHGQFQLKSCNAQSCKTSSIVSIKPPSKLTVTMDDSEVLQFNWLNVSYATHYKVLVKYQGDSDFTQLSDDIMAGEQSFQMAAALPGLQDAQFQLETCNASGCVATVAEGLVAAPLKLSFNDPLVDNKFYLTWDDVAYASDYKLYKKTSTEADFSLVEDNIPAGQQRHDQLFNASEENQSQFKLASCNASGCLTATVTVATAIPSFASTDQQAIKFIWQDVDYATHYQLWAELNVGSGWQKISEDIAVGTEQYHYIVSDLADHDQTGFVLKSCNDSGCNASTPISLEASALAIRYQAAGQFHFDWPSTAFATHYQLFENPDGRALKTLVKSAGDSFSIVVSDIPAGTQSIDYHVTLADRTHAQYLLKSCNAAGCLASAPVSVAIETAALNPVAFATDTYQLSWTDVGSATHYQLWEDPDGVSGFSQVGGDVPAGTESIAHAVVLADRTHAQYQLYSCNAVGCLPSAPVSVAFTAAQPSIEFGNNSYRIRWVDIVGARHYQLEEDPNGSSVFSRISGDILPGEQQYDGTVDPVDKPNAHYRLNTCYEVGCIPSSVVIAKGFRSADLNLAFANDKTFAFTWVDSIHVDYYQLLENPDGLSGFIQVGEDIAAGIEAYDHIVPLYARTNAQYILNSCNALGCLSSATISVADTMVNSISYIKASNTGAYDKFGKSMALSDDGSLLVVGASGEASSASEINGDTSDNNAPNAGAVYVFVRQSEGWVEQAYIKASNSEAGDEFGIAVALNGAGDLLAVGAGGEDSSAQGVNGDTSNNSASNAGATYLYQRSGDVWSEYAYIKASNSEAGDNFGNQVSLSNDGTTLAVSAYSEGSAAVGINGDASSNRAIKSGAVYIFQRSGHTWAEQAYIKASNTDRRDQFGGAMNLSANGLYLVVGAKYERSSAKGINGDGMDNTASYSGAAYVFSRDGEEWTEQGYLKASNNYSSLRFGYSVAINATGDLIAVGARDENSAAIGIDGDQQNSSASNSGAVYLFSREGNIWRQAHYIKSSNTEGQDNFGESVALSNDGQWLAVSAGGEKSSALGVNGDQTDNGNGGKVGAVYIFHRSVSSWQQTAYLKPPNSSRDYDFFGMDINLSGDGQALAVGAHAEGSASTTINGDPNNYAAEYSGAVYMY